MQNKDGGACIPPNSSGFADQAIDIAFTISRQRLKMLLSSGVWEVLFEKETSEDL